MLSSGSDRVTVKLQDGRQFVGKVFRDQRSDLALIKVNASNLPAAEFANSDGVKVGQWAIAFGSPFGLNDTMTVGVVSSTKRQAKTIGGSGADGRLVSEPAPDGRQHQSGQLRWPACGHVYGRIMGINVAIESPSGGNVGIGFAIPSNQARYIMEQLAQQGNRDARLSGICAGIAELRRAEALRRQRGRYSNAGRDGPAGGQGRS